MTPQPSEASRPRILITAGPTWEPIDRVRFLGNRSSGRLGVEMAHAARARSLPTTVLLGPGVHADLPSQVAIERFQTTADLEASLRDFWPEHDILIMAAAVADFRPAGTPPEGKIERGGGGIDLRLEATPDLLAELAKLDHHGTRIGFALEGPENLGVRALEKLTKKHLHAIVANPLDTMESDSIEGVLIPRGGEPRRPPTERMSKPDFAAWLIDQAIDLHGSPPRRPAP